MMAVELRALRLQRACEPMKWVPHPPPTDACIGLDTWAPNINLNRDPVQSRYRDLRLFRLPLPIVLSDSTHASVVVAEVGQKLGGCV